MTSADDIADALVAHFNAQTFAIASQFENPASVPVFDAASPDAASYVYPFEETEETIDRGDAFRATRTIALALFAQVTADRGKKACMAWANEIKESLRELELDGDESSTWRFVGVTTVSLYDFEEMKAGRYLSLFNIVFQNFG